MNWIAATIDAAEHAPLPDRVTLAGVDFLCGRTARRMRGIPAQMEERFAAGMGDFPIALHVEAANAQHYELPPAFFGLALGPRRKYSCCYYPKPETTLADAERFALDATCDHAALADGQRILELGCGWGSLSLHMAELFPRASIVAVSNSHSQRAYILSEAQRRGLANLEIVTADMNAFAPPGGGFDRIVSIEMFEHMSNWRGLLARAREWLSPEGRMFLHVFTHRSRSYRFDHDDPADWIARHFFTGGLMPAHDLPHRFGDLFAVEQEWRWSGEHYQRTALDWLANFDREGAPVMDILDKVYGADAKLWRRRWRLFFLATAGLFGHARGAEWGVGHYRLTPVKG